VPNLRPRPAKFNVEKPSDGNLTLTLFINGIYPQRNPSKPLLGLYVVIWFDDGGSGGPRIRTLILNVERSYWERQAGRPWSKTIALE